jgi:tetratricopeptide (TPR) repeat protein
LLSGWYGILQGDYGASRPLLEECKARAEQVGDELGVAYAEQYLGNIYVFQGETKRGLNLCEAALARFRKLNNRVSLMILLFQLGFCYSLAGEVERGIAACDESLILNRDDGERCIRGYALYVKCFGYWLRGEYQVCAELASDSLRMRYEIGDSFGIASCLETLSWVAVEQGRYRQAAYLLGAAHRLWEKTGTPLFGVLKASHDTAEQRIRQALGQHTYKEAFHTGTALTVDQAVNHANLA